MYLESFIFPFSFSSDPWLLDVWKCLVQATRRLRELWEDFVRLDIDSDELRSIRGSVQVAEQAAAAEESCRLYAPRLDTALSYCRVKSCSINFLSFKAFCQNAQRHLFYSLNLVESRSLVQFLKNNFIISS